MDEEILTKIFFGALSTGFLVWMLILLGKPLLRKNSLIPGPHIITKSGMTDINSIQQKYSDLNRTLVNLRNSDVLTQQEFLDKKATLDLNKEGEINNLKDYAVREATQSMVKQLSELKKTGSLSDEDYDQIVQRLTISKSELLRKVNYNYIKYESLPHFRKKDVKELLYQNKGRNLLFFNTYKNIIYLFKEEDVIKYQNIEELKGSFLVLLPPHLEKYNS